MPSNSILNIMTLILIYIRLHPILTRNVLFSEKTFRPNLHMRGNFVSSATDTHENLSNVIFMREEQN